ncbi:MAG: hypothetical protein SV775_16750 [Thermodesulfobacteriota bacterium]|nr:hypothetical protein [Thermodesulfobacteriota bacterium]
MEKHNKYAVIGLRALRRAAAKVAEDARKNNYKIPVWRGEHIEFVVPGVITEDGAVDQGQSGPIEK